MDEPTERPPPPPRPSQIPSWVLLGFAVGALFVWALPRGSRPAEVAGPTVTKTVVLERPKATDIEAVFSEYSQNAVWDRDLTEVALWDVDKREYSICYEIMRSGDAYYFRSIPRLTRPVLTHGLKGHAPMLFTETEEQRREWLDAKQREPLTPPGIGK